MILLQYGVMPLISHLWSISAEEQFYLFWPILFRYFKNKTVIIGIVILSFFLLNSVVFQFLISIKKITFDNHYISLFRGFLFFSGIGSMAIGGLFALLVFKKSKVVLIITNKIIFILTIILLVYSFYNGIKFSVFDNELYSVYFAILICNLALIKDNKYSILESKLFYYLGKISYGLYMYHPISILFCLRILIYFNIYNNYSMYIFTILFTIIIASLSYTFFELRFIKLKTSFSLVVRYPPY